MGGLVLKTARIPFTETRPILRRLTRNWVQWQAAEHLDRRDPQREEKGKETQADRPDGVEIAQQQTDSEKEEVGTTPKTKIAQGREWLALPNGEKARPCARNPCRRLEVAQKADLTTVQRGGPSEKEAGGNPHC